MLIFEWDKHKADRNTRKHRVSFSEAISVFRDPLADTFYDDENSLIEDRFIEVGKSDSGRILVIAFTERNDIIRIISARKATKKESRYYEYG